MGQREMRDRGKDRGREEEGKIQGERAERGRATKRVCVNKEQT